MALILQQQQNFTDASTNASNSMKPRGGYRKPPRFVPPKSNSIIRSPISEEREDSFSKASGLHKENEDIREQRTEESYTVTGEDETATYGEEFTQHTRGSYVTRRGRRRYQFDGGERSVRKNESMTTYDYDSDDYEDMASKKSGRRTKLHVQRVESSRSQFSDRSNRPDSAGSAGSSFASSGSEDATVDKSLISRTVNKMTESTKKKNRNGNEEVLRRKHTKACKYLRDGSYAKSLKLFEEILGGLVTKYSKTHHRVGTAMHNIGIVHLRAGDLDLALDAINVAVKIREDTHGPKHPKVADSLVELGIIFLSRREFEDSLSAFNEALALREERLDRKEDDRKLNLQVAKVLNNIGCVYYEYGELHNALKTFEEALEIQQQYLGADDPTVEPGVLSMASTMCNIAYVHIEDKNFTSASYMLEQAFQIQEAVLEADNKLVLNTLDNLAYTYYKNGSYDEAMKHYEDILDTQQQAFGESHIDCAATIKKIAFIYLKECKFETALEKLLQVMKIEEKHLSPSNREIQETSRMINEMNFQLLKFPRIWEAFVTSLKRRGVFKNPFTCRAFECSCLGTADTSIDTNGIEIKPPQNSSKMAGHKVAYA